MRASVVAFALEGLRIGWLEVFPTRRLDVDKSVVATGSAVAELFVGAIIVGGG